MEPTIILEWTRLGVVVRNILYGPVSEARYEREKAITQHRAEQLEVQFPRPARKPKKREQEWED